MEERIPSPRRYTVEDYFRMEAETDERLEYMDGQVLIDGQRYPGGRAVAMSGGSVNHSRIVNNVGGELRSRLKGTPCETFDPGLRVRLGRAGRYAHPDVTVVCGPVELDLGDPDGETVVNPRLVVEVLSRSTELYDRTRKAEAFRELESLQEYVLVSQHEPRIETVYRNSDGVWSIGPTVTDPFGSASLRSLGIDLPLAEVYARVAFPPPADGAAGDVAPPT